MRASSVCVITGRVELVDALALDGADLMPAAAFRLNAFRPDLVVDHLRNVLARTSHRLRDLPVALACGGAFAHLANLFRRRLWLTVVPLRLPVPVEVGPLVDCLQVLRVDARLVLAKVMYGFFAKLLARRKYIAEPMRRPTDVPIGKTPVPAEVLRSDPLPAPGLLNDVGLPLHKRGISATPANAPWKHHDPLNRVRSIEWIVPPVRRGRVLIPCPHTVAETGEVPSAAFPAREPVTCHPLPCSPSSRQATGW